ncbi:unnamed protein product [Ectocarpus fasciculatus]
MISQLLAVAIGAVLYVSLREATFQNGRIKEFVALDHLSYGTLKCCWWTLGSVWKTMLCIWTARPSTTCHRAHTYVGRHARCPIAWNSITRGFHGYCDFTWAVSTIEVQLEFLEEVDFLRERAQMETTRAPLFSLPSPLQISDDRDDHLSKIGMILSTSVLSGESRCQRHTRSERTPNLAPCTCLVNERLCAYRKTPSLFAVYNTGIQVLPVGSSKITLRMVDYNRGEYKALCAKFNARWIKPRPANGVSVVRIFSIKVSRWMRFKHALYTFIFGNMCQRFHGTSCNEGCNFMLGPQGGEAVPCGKSSCSVCNICKLGFKLGTNVARTARATLFPLRYGAGIYLTSVSGKANDYAGRSAKKLGNGSELRCMFVASVALGNPFKTKRTGLPPDECPPSGYQSVVGEVGQGLNYDEFVVYREEAVLPTHLIVYALRH